ncbi:hypothetical protein [Streptomyces avermitilis]|uniref:hypothetical protein n=1 Tax=Streptomyces avermitilis TaxID=33903 RepID=UPI0034054555
MGPQAAVLKSDGTRRSHRPLLLDAEVKTFRKATAGYADVDRQVLEEQLVRFAAMSLCGRLGAR